jgi:AraC family transcriptional regulator
LSPDTRLPPVVVGGLPASKVRRVTAFIESNLHRELRLKELAAVTHMSPYHFARLFKRATGVSPHRFVVRRRIDAATALLTESTSSIGSIARAVGFRTASHFATTVRRITGITPSGYRVRRAVAEPPVETSPVVAADADETIPTLPK